MPDHPDLTIDIRTQTGELPLAVPLGVVTGTGPLPSSALRALESAAGERAAQVAEAWPTPPHGQREDPGKPLADFLLSGVQLIPGRVAIAERGSEIEAGWVGIGTLTAVSGSLRWADEPR